MWICAIPWPSATAMVKAAEAARSRSSLLSCLAWPDSTAVEDFGTKKKWTSLAKWWLSYGALWVIWYVLKTCGLTWYVTCKQLYTSRLNMVPNWKKCSKNYVWKNGFSVQGLPGLQLTLWPRSKLGVDSWELSGVQLGLGGFQGLCYLGCEICTSNLLNSGHPEPARCFWGYAASLHVAGGACQLQ